VTVVAAAARFDRIKLTADADKTVYRLTGGSDSLARLALSLLLLDCCGTVRKRPMSWAAGAGPCR
jgi:hypothetical protein